MRKNIPETGHYVYKFVLNKEILYIGKSNKQTFDRIDQHGKPGDNIVASGWDDINRSNIFYYCLPTTYICDLVESELIRRYKPKYNVAKTRTKWNGLLFPEPCWEVYRVIDGKYLELKAENSKLASVNSQLKQYIADLEDDYNKYKDSHSSNYKRRCEMLEYDFSTMCKIVKMYENKYGDHTEEYRRKIVGVN